jgi:acetate kinase
VELGGVTALGVVNAGSSSTKVAVLGDGDELLEAVALPAAVEPVGRERVEAALADLWRRWEPAASVHRVVHGGPRWRSAVLVDDRAEPALRELSSLAPLHNPPALALLDVVRRIAPRSPAVACFDTAFFADLPAAAATYALPREWREGLGVRRYGFHGLSHAYAARRAPELLGARGASERQGGEAGGLRVVTAHLGSGCSLAAVVGGRALDTTMGFTPVEGLVMATRSGSVDPGALAWLCSRAGVSPADLEDGLERRSGLLGLAGSADLAEVMGRAAAGDVAAQLAYDVYQHRLRAGIASMAAALAGLDVLAFTGGAGEASPRLRRDACAGLGFLGLCLDEEANARLVGGGAEGVVSSGGAAAVVVVAAREDLEMARAARSLLGLPA